MGEGTHGNEVDAAFGIIAQGVEGDAAAGLCLELAADEFHGFAGVFHGEIVEHDAVGSAMFHDLAYLVERAALDFDFKMQPLFLLVGGAAVQGAGYAAAEVDVVVLEQNHVEQPDAVVDTAADLHGFFFEHSHTGCGLARVKHTGVGALEPFHIAVGHGGDAAHALHDVEHEAFGLQEGAHLSRDEHGNIAGLDGGAVGEQYLHPERGVETVEHFLGNAHAGKYSFFLDEQLGSSLCIFGDAAEGGVVAVADVLGEGEVDETVVQFVNCVHGVDV